MNNKFSDTKKYKKGKTISQIWQADDSTELECPIYKEAFSAGFPSPATDYIENTLDLNKFLIQHPSATFFVRVEGDSMINAGIRSGDILIVDRAIQPEEHKIVIAVINEELTIKRIKIIKKKIYLEPDNPDFNLIEVTPEMDFRIWGVVTYVIHKT
ncbi:MAG: translesion error-prone DNA polymerase V autoproteolytic subunit [Candidatus Cloacimonetes bacterium]|nr:translesion error-prone DNA polymerase V autoproteolytic subunit [Candidatus Cloacimonadota bacterium]